MGGKRPIASLQTISCAIKAIRRRNWILEIGSRQAFFGYLGGILGLEVEIVKG